MKLLFSLFALALCLAAQTPPSLHGTVTDPSGALVPGALVQLRGPGGEQRSTTNSTGEYSFPTLRPGKYTARVIAKGFTVSQKSVGARSVLRPGDYFGEVALAMGVPRTASVRALTQATVASCDRATFDEFIRPLFADA